MCQHKIVTETDAPTCKCLQGLQEIRERLSGHNAGEEGFVACHPGWFSVRLQISKMNVIVELSPV